jgi:hypothetical protein
MAVFTTILFLKQKKSLLPNVELVEEQVFIAPQLNVLPAKVVLILDLLLVLIVMEDLNSHVNYVKADLAQDPLLVQIAMAQEALILK